MSETEGKASLTCLLAIAEVEASKLEDENGRLRERITTQKQTIQAYRDESREWREEAEHAQAENDKLRELCADMFNCISHANEQDWFYFARDEAGCGMSCTVNGEGCGLSVLANRMRELGVEE